MNKKIRDIVLRDHKSNLADATFVYKEKVMYQNYETFIAERYRGKVIVFPAFPFVFLR